MPAMNTDWEKSSWRAALQGRAWGLCWTNARHEPAVGACSQKADCVLGCTNRGVGSRGRREGIVPLCSALGRPHLECCVLLWGPQHQKGVGLLGQVQRRAMRMIRGLELLSCEERLRELGLGVFSLEKALW